MAEPQRERPAHDPRFTMGVMIDVAQIFVEHGYPKINAGKDLVELQQALFRYLYVDTDLGTRALEQP